MKYEIGDKIIVLLTEEEGQVVEIINEKMVMIEVKGVRFPTYTDQIDFPYFKMFTTKKPVEKKKVYIDHVKKEKQAIIVKKEENGVHLSLVPVFDKDIFDDDIVEKLKCYLINQTNEKYNFNYSYNINTENIFQLKNVAEPFTDFYLHDVDFNDLSHNPQINIEFSLANPQKNKMPYYESVLKLKGKNVFKKIEEVQLANQSSFSYELFKFFPNKVEEEKLDLSKLNTAGYKIYDASKIKQHLPPAQSVVDLHIEKITDNYKHLSNTEIINLQLQTFEKYFELAVLHYLPTLIIIHGVGEGVLKDEIHSILKTKRQVKYFVNQHNPLYGFGATEIFF